MLGHRVHGIVADVGDRDTAGLAVRYVDHVVTGGCDRDHLEVGKLSERFAAKRYLVRDCYGGSLQPLDDLVRAGSCVILPNVLESGTAHLGTQGRAIEEDDLMHGGLRLVAAIS